MYKELVEKANTNLRRHETESAILKRNTYFVLDEFANLPKFENIEGMVTVSRSRGVRWLFILQSYSQLAAKYGKDVGDIIKTNCNVKIFIGSDDPETRKEFSELCGNKKIKNFSVNTSAENPASGNTGATNQPLITVGMLERINGDTKGDAIVSVRGYEPIWTKFTPSYELKDVYFKEGKADLAKREAVIFDKDEYVFDIQGDTTVNQEDIILDEIEKLDQITEAGPETADDTPLAELDEKWEAAVADIHVRLDKITPLLTGRDSKTVRAASLENKPKLLYAFMESYDTSTAKKIQDIADYISGTALERLKELQNSAVK